MRPTCAAEGNLICRVDYDAQGQYLVIDGRSRSQDGGAAPAAPVRHRHRTARQQFIFRPLQ
ncbi:hypothetical protein [Streptomyces aureus]|uniref:hypothetical protein n=1 Tax=Streptomyces aureus TaxID=193461 RepID=UPI0033E6E359